MPIDPDYFLNLEKEKTFNQKEVFWCGPTCHIILSASLLYRVLNSPEQEQASA